MRGSWLAKSGLKFLVGKAGEAYVLIGEARCPFLADEAREGASDQQGWRCKFCLMRSCVEFLAGEAGGASFDPLGQNR